jgi:hypothetical protein
MGSPILKEIFMDIWGFNETVKKKMNEMSDEDSESLDPSHRFLKMALDEDRDISDAEIDSMGITDQNIHIDGYYTEDTQKEFHILEVVYFEGGELTPDPQKVFDLIDQKRNQAINFVKAAIKKSPLQESTSPLYEPINEFDSFWNQEKPTERGKIIVDFYTNVQIPDLETSLYTRKIAIEHMADVYFDYTDAVGLDAAFQDNDNSNLQIELTKTYGSPLYAVRISSCPEFDVYETSISGNVLAKLYGDKKNAIMEGNVRSYLKRTQTVNSGISSTIQEKAGYFSAYNNGLSTIAEGDGSEIAKISGNFFRIDRLDHLQIVNGGQTTVTLYTCKTDSGYDLNDVVVPMKITVIKDKNSAIDLVTNVARYANTQTAIAKSELSSNEFFYRQLESLSRSIPAYKFNVRTNDNAFYWFFERTNGLYNTERRIVYKYSAKFARLNPPEKRFTKKAIAKAVNAFERQPNLVCLGNEKSFAYFNSQVVGNMVVPDPDYYMNLVGCLILWQKADKIILKAGIPIKAAVLPYTIAKISEMAHQRIDLHKIFENQKIDDGLATVILEVAKAINQYFTSVLPEHPNTLMWGRKPECWEFVKNHIYYNFPYMELLTKPIEFYPQNPAIVFIDNLSNMNDLKLWEKIIAWNADSKFFRDVQVNSLSEIANEIRLSAKLRNQARRQKAKDLFLAAVKGGFRFDN